MACRRSECLQARHTSCAFFRTRRYLVVLVSGGVMRCSRDPSVHGLCRGFHPPPAAARLSALRLPGPSRAARWPPRVFKGNGLFTGMYLYRIVTGTGAAGKEQHLLERGRC